MTENVNEILFRKHQPQAGEPTPPPGYENLGGAFVTAKFREFVQMAVAGELPEPEKVPELDPKILELAAELAVIHLPEWRNPAGRKLADPTSMRIGSSVRVAQYLIERGVRFEPEHATVRWMSTPGAVRHAGDPGKHLYRLPDGTWPEAPDAEEFWSIDDITCEQLDNGRWAAVHPRGIQCEDDSKAEAFGMCVERVRAKIRELKGVS